MIRDVDYWIRLKNDLQSERSNFDTLWQEIKDYYAPYDLDFVGWTIAGSKRGQNVYNSDPIFNLQRYISNIYSQLLPLTQDYFSLVLDSYQLSETPRVKRWLYACEQEVYQCFTRSRYRLATVNAMRPWATYGVSGMFLRYLGNGEMLFMARPLPELYLQDNLYDEVDTVIRVYEIEARKILQQWEDALDAETRDAMAQKPQEKQEVIHVIAPVESESLFNPEHRFLSLYILSKQKVELNRYGGLYRGFVDFPYMIARHDKCTQTAYGYSQTAIALADAKTRNKLTELKLKAIAKEVDPPLQTRANSVIGRVRLGPGQMNYLKGDAELKPILGKSANWSNVMQEEERMQNTHRDMFFNSHFMSFRQHGPNISAAEIEEARSSVHRESVPIVSRLEQEFLAPLVLNTFLSLYRDGWLPQAPPEVEGRSIHVKSVGPLALNQEFLKVSSAERLLQWIQQLHGTETGRLMDMSLRGDVLIREMARVTDVWPQAVRSEEEIAALVAEQDQAAAMQQNVEMAKMGAEAYGKVA